MAKPAAPPMSPTVVTVFTEFLKGLEAEKDFDASIVERLRQCLNDQDLDADTLRDALFYTEPTKS